MHVAPGECLHRLVGDERIRTAEAGSRRDDVHTDGDDRITRLGRGRKSQRVRQLPAEVQSADEHEHVAEHRATPRAELLREREARVGRHEHLGARTAAVGGRQQKNSPAHTRLRPRPCMTQYNTRSGMAAMAIIAVSTAITNAQSAEVARGVAPAVTAAACRSRSAKFIAFDFQTKSNRSPTNGTTPSTMSMPTFSSIRT